MREEHLHKIKSEGIPFEVLKDMTLEELKEIQDQYTEIVKKVRCVRHEKINHQKPKMIINKYLESLR